MISIHRAERNPDSRRREPLGWTTIFPTKNGERVANGFNLIESFKEGRLPPRAATEQPSENVEVVTYVREGTLAYQDSAGGAGFIHAGEFQRMTAGQGVRYGEINPSPTEWTQAFQVTLLSAGGIVAGHEQRRYTNAERRGVWCVVASPDARGGSLRLHEDVVLFSVILRRGQHVFHELTPERRGWLHVVAGSLRLAEYVLGSGDSAQVVAERAISLTAEVDSEVLLLDICAPNSQRNSGHQSPVEGNNCSADSKPPNRQTA